MNTGCGAGCYGCLLLVGLFWFAIVVVGLVGQALGLIK